MFPQTSTTTHLSDLFKTTHHTLTQLSEAQRLHHLVQPTLPDEKRAWIESTLRDVADAAHDMRVLLEPCRVEQQTRQGRLSLTTHLRWLYRDGAKAEAKSRRLLACHNSLMAVLAYLQPLEPQTNVVCHELGAGPPSRDCMVPGMGMGMGMGMWSGSGSVPSENREYSRDREYTRDGEYSRGRASESCGSQSGEEQKGGNGAGGAVEGLNGELQDMLAWRRSKGAFGLASRSEVRIMGVDEKSV